MSLDIGDAIKDGFSRTATGTGGILIGAFIAVGLGMTAALNSLVVRLVTRTFDLRPAFADIPDLTYQEFVSQIQGQAPLNVLDAPAVVLGFLVVLAWVVQTMVRIGAIRWFVEEQRGGLSGELFTRRLLWTIGNLVVGFVLVAVITVVLPIGVAFAAAEISPALGLIVLIVALVVMFFLIVSLYFYKYHIVVEGANAIEALSDSWRLTKGDRLVLFVLGAIFAIGGGIVGGVAGLVTGQNLLASVIVTQVVGASLGVVTIGVASDAFNQLRGVEPGGDEEPGALGAEDLA